MATQPRHCDVCRSLFVPGRSDARYCSAAHRKKAQRLGIATPRGGAPAKPVAVPTPPVDVEQSTDEPLTTAVMAELTEASKHGTAAGQTCLALARRIDHGQGETGSALASLSRELRAAMTEALGQGAKPRESKLQLLRAAGKAG